MVSKADKANLSKLMAELGGGSLTKGSSGYNSGKRKASELKDSIKDTLEIATMRQLLEKRTRAKVGIETHIERNLEAARKAKSSQHPSVGSKVLDEQRRLLEEANRNNNRYWHLIPEAESKYGYDEWRVRDRPSFSGNVVQVLKVEQRFIVSGSHGDWLQVSLGRGKSGWVYPMLKKVPGQVRLLMPVGYDSMLLQASEGLLKRRRHYAVKDRALNAGRCRSAASTGSFWRQSSANRFIKEADACVVPQPMDGSCLFHSLSYGMDDGSDASSLRLDISNYIAGNPDMVIAGTALKDWIKFDSGVQVAAYASEIAGGAWGGGIEIEAFVRLKDVNVHVFETCPGGYRRISVFDAGPGDHRTVTLLYQGSEHYDALAPVNAILQGYPIDAEEAQLQQAKSSQHPSVGSKVLDEQRRLLEEANRNNNRYWHLIPEAESTYNVDEWRVRERPSFSGRVVAVLKVGQRFIVSGRQGDWLQVSLGRGKSGWVYPMLKGVPGQESEVRLLMPVG